MKNNFHNAIFFILVITSLGLISCNDSSDKKTVKRTWTQPMKDSIYDACVASANLGDQILAANLCNCLVETYVNHFPDPDSLKNADSSVLIKLAKSCSDTSTVFVSGGNSLSPNGKWQQADKDAFLKGCILGWEQKVSHADAVIQCNCTLDKIIAIFPEPVNAANITDEMLNKIQDDCLK